MAGAMPMFDWTGAYVGGTVGYGWGNSATDGTSFYNDAAGTSYAGSLPGISYADKGLLGGGEAGFNWQAGGLVFGVQADIAAANISGTYVDKAHAYSVDGKLNWLSTVRAQAGVAMGRFIVYGTGGLAVGGLEADLHDTYATVVNTSDSKTSVGYTVGAGVAAALSDHWIAKLEYQYVDLGTQDYRFKEPSPPGWPLITATGKTTAGLLRASVDYRF